MASPTERYKTERKDGPGVDTPLWVRILQEHHDLLTALARVELGGAPPERLKAMKKACEVFVGDPMVLSHAVADVGRPVTAHERIEQLDRECKDYREALNKRDKEIKALRQRAERCFNERKVAAQEYLAECNKLTERAEKAEKDRDGWKSMLDAANTKLNKVGEIIDTEG